MPRYFIKLNQLVIAKRDIKSEPRASWWEPNPTPLPYPTVSETTSIDTGLLDKDGNRIMRAPDKIGAYYTCQTLESGGMNVKN